LNAHDGLKKVLLAQNAAGKRIGAICAAPLILGGLGILKGKKATCYPGFENTLTGAEYTPVLVQEDGNITTGEGPAAAFPYAYKILSYFVGEETAKNVADGMMYTHLMSNK
jgi:4-methyl-5(b-hydroxyethyl)-thiazole monophosphate biosynthesis